MSSLEKLARALEMLRTSDAATAGGATSPGSPVEPTLRSSLADLKPAALLFRLGGGGNGTVLSMERIVFRKR